MAKMAARPALRFKFFRRISNAGVRVGGQQHAIDRQTAGSCGRIADVTRFPSSGPASRRRDAYVVSVRAREYAPGKRDL